MISDVKKSYIILLISKNVNFFEIEGEEEGMATIDTIILQKITDSDGRIFSLSPQCQLH